MASAPKCPIKWGKNSAQFQNMIRSLPYLQLVLLVCYQRDSFSPHVSFQVWQKWYHFITNSFRCYDAVFLIHFFTNKSDCIFCTTFRQNKALHSFERIVTLECSFFPSSKHLPTLLVILPSSKMSNFGDSFENIPVYLENHLIKWY